MFEHYDLNDIDAEIIDAFITAFVDRDAMAMHELIYQLSDFMDLYENKEEHDE